MHSADRMRDTLDQWNQKYEDAARLGGRDDGDHPDAKKDSEESPVQNNPEETRKNTVLLDIKTRRLVLRAGAMSLARAKIRPITIVDLPADILRKIFDYF
ncbi:hypothetical protein BBP40_010322 [Aspergillus hancockii]|nr:hypothetical protein BBP40_010322 [Aspergillus hancockii]